MVFVVMQAATLFGAADRIDIVGFWVYVAILAAVALGSWISIFIAPIALVLLLWRTIVEDHMLPRDLPGYGDYAAPRPAPAAARPLVTLRYL